MSIITLDFETPYGKGAREGHILHKYSLSHMTYERYIRDSRFKVFGVGYQVNDGASEYLSNESKPGIVKEFLNDTFTPGNDHIAVAHNMLFDGAILSWFYNLRAATYWCTQAMSRAIWNQRSASLEQLCISCYPDDPSIRKGTELVNFANIYDLSPDQDLAMGKYCVNDIDITWQCLKYLWPLFPDDELEILDMTLQMGVHPAFCLDRDRVQVFLDEYNQATDKIVADSGVARSTLASPTKFAAWVKEKLNLDIPIIDAPTPTNPDNRKYALGKDEMAFVNFRAEHPQYEHIWKARLRVASTIDRTRANRMLEHGAVCDLNPEGRIATPLNYAAAHTLRWGGTNKINFQNLRRGSELRKALCSPPGYVVGVQDLSNIEVRMNAWFCQELKMLRVFASEGDIYNDFASAVYGRPIERKAVDDNGVEYMWTEGFVGKTCILGLGYQTGPPKLKNTLFLQSNGEVNLSLEACKKIVYDDYRGIYTQIVNGWQEAERAIQQMYHLKTGETWAWNCLVVEHNRIRLPNGMYLNYPRLRCEMDQYDRPQFEYWNGKHWTNIYGGKLIENIIQALSRIVIADSMLTINRHLKESPDTYGEEARVGLTVHDETVVIAKEDSITQALDVMREIMVRPPDWCNDGSLTLAAEGGWDFCYSK